MNRSKVYILSDGIRKGKTTALQEWTKKTKNITGFLSPDVNDKRMFQDIETGALISMEIDRGDLIVGKFTFDSKSFRYVEDNIVEAWEAATSNFIVLDEIGPLEVKKDLGFHKLLLYLQKKTPSKKPNLLFVVRDYCLETFKEKYDFEIVKIMNLKQFKSDFN